MSQDFSNTTADISRAVIEIRKALPDVMKGFSALASAATADGELDVKTKEFIALAISVATHCDGCIGFHCKALVKLGVTRSQVMEVLGVAVYMGGGPSLMYAADAVRAYDEFVDIEPA